MSRITQKGQGAPLSLQANGVFQTSTDANLASLTGNRWDLDDGREVMLVSVLSTSTATAGTLLQYAPLVPNHQNINVTAFTAYSNNGNIPASAIVTLGATAMTAQQYQNGLAIVVAGTGKGQTLKIANNTAAVSSGTQGVITFEDGPNTNLDSTSYISLIPDEGSNVVVSPTTRTNVTCGAAFYTIPPGSYGFVITKGMTGILSDPTIAGVGYAISPSSSSVGTITVATSTGSTLTNGIIGYAAIAGTSGYANPVFINV